MTAAVRLEKIVPFNEIYYRGCFYNSLFSALPYFGANELPLLLNDTISYGRNEETGMIRADYREARGFGEVMADLGVAMLVRERVGDLVGTVARSILEGRPAIVSVDCFYIPDRADTYRKLHWSHSLLVFGYDEQAGRFDIVEHKDRDSLTYEKKTIAARDLERAFEGYLESESQWKAGRLEGWPSNDAPPYAEFDAVDLSAPLRSRDAEAVAAEFDEGMRSSVPTLARGLETLRSFATDYRATAEDEAALAASAEALTNACTDIINAKTVEKYRLERLSGSLRALAGRYETASRLTREVLAEWNAIRIAIGKFLYSGIYKKEALVGLGERFRTIAELEVEAAACWGRAETAPVRASSGTEPSPSPINGGRL